MSRVGGELPSGASGADEGALEPRSRLVLDTSAYVHLRTGHPGVHHLLAAAEVVHVPTIVLGELEAGFAQGRRATENRLALAEFLAEPFVSVHAVSPEVARCYGGLVAALRRRGTPVPINAAWIAARALDLGAPTLTFDGHFESIHEVESIVLAVA